ncbi:hypothetical protein DRN52_03745 [Thermococci archaeon]|nr:MAG: hypothetical protein DRN52_03745 [Thermococci archaeon]
MVDEVLVLPIYQGKPRRWIALVEKDILDYQTLQKRAEVLFDLYSKKVRTFSFEADPLQTYGKAGIGDLVEVISKRLGLKATARVITIEISESSRGLSTRYEVGSPEWKLEEFIKSLSPRVFQKYDVGQVIGVYHGTTVDPVKDSPAVTYFALPSELLETVMLYMDVAVRTPVSRYETEYPISFSDPHSHNITIKASTLGAKVRFYNGVLWSTISATIITSSAGATSHSHEIKVHKTSALSGEPIYVDESHAKLMSKYANVEFYFQTEEALEHTHVYKVHGGWETVELKCDSNSFKADISSDLNVSSLSEEVTCHYHPIKIVSKEIGGVTPENVQVEILTPEGTTYTIDLGSGIFEKKGINIASIFKSAGLYKMTWKTDTMATINFIIYGQILIRSVVY